MAGAERWAASGRGLALDSAFAETSFLWPLAIRFYDILVYNAASTRTGSFSLRNYLLSYWHSVHAALTSPVQGTHPAHSGYGKTSMLDYGWKMHGRWSRSRWSMVIAGFSRSRGNACDGLEAGVSWLLLCFSTLESDKSRVSNPKSLAQFGSLEPDKMQQCSYGDELLCQTRSFNPPSSVCLAPEIHPHLNSAQILCYITTQNHRSHSCTNLSAFLVLTPKTAASYQSQHA